MTSKNSFSNQCRIAALTGILALSSTNAFPLRDKPDIFFKPGPEAPQGLPVGALYPNGDTLLFSIAGEVGGKHLAEAKRIGVPILDLNLKDAEKEGVKVGYPLGVARKEGDLVFADAESLAKEIGSQVKAAAAEPRIAFWHLKPGEFQIRNAKDIEYLRVTNKVIGESDPLKRPIWTFCGPEVPTGYLSNMAPWVDCLGKSLEVDSKKNDSRILVRWSMERAVEATHEVETTAIPVAVPVLSTSDDVAASIPASVRHDLYLSLVVGAKGVVAMPGKGEPKADCWDAFQTACLKIADELLGEQKLGELFLYAERREDLEIDIVDGPEELEMTLPSGSETTRYPAVMHLDLAYGKDRYLVLVNSALQPVTLMVGGMPYNAVNAEDLLEAGALMPIAEGEFETDLKPLEVKIYRFTRR